MKVLITGVAGFIGNALAKRLLDEGHSVIGVDVVNDYYSIDLKEDRLKRLDHNNFTFLREDIVNTAGIDALFKEHRPTHVVALAGQAGVRYSIINPYSYIQANLVGFGNILESCRQYDVENLLYASSSSVYGLNTKLPYQETDFTGHQVSLYAATKKSNELMAHSYAHLYNLPTTGLRFFTVYGPWGRPDMSPHLFTSAILEDREIKVFNYGKMKRDFTYIDDIVQSVYLLLQKPATPNAEWDSNNPDPSTSSAPFRVFNIGNSDTIELMTFIETIEKALGKEAKKDFMPMQDGDVVATSADTSSLIDYINFKPSTKLEDGIAKFVDWHKSYYCK